MSFSADPLTSCPCKHEFCYACGARWKSCDCPQWSPEHLLEAAAARDNHYNRFQEEGLLERAAARARHNRFGAFGAENRHEEDLFERRLARDNHYNPLDILHNPFAEVSNRADGLGRRNSLRVPINVFAGSEVINRAEQPGYRNPFAADLQPGQYTANVAWAAENPLNNHSRDQ